MRTEIYKTFRGYEIQINREGSRWPLCVRSVYKGVANVNLDYVHAKAYTKKTAERIARQLEAGELIIK